MGDTWVQAWELCPPWKAGSKPTCMEVTMHHLNVSRETPAQCPTTWTPVWVCPEVCMGLRPRHTVGGQAWPTGSWSGRESAPSHRGKDLTLAKLRETLAVSNPGGLSRPFPGLGRGCPQARALGLQLRGTVHCRVRGVWNTGPTLCKCLLWEFNVIQGVGCLVPGSQRKGN